MVKNIDIFFIDMDIKLLRSKTGLSQKEFGTRLGLTSQSITKFEAGANITSSIKKLIRYEFAEFLPESERLVSKEALQQVSHDSAEVEKLRQELELARMKAEKAESLQQMVDMQNKTIQLMEDQLQMYKERLSLSGDASKTA
ncbi:helix-turn-helix domain-containing protein [Christiangramia marina]|uniref:helix-turn-helix domain-containing protein n=1 Tax=Christiangramia marina TaxID=409436 RepID=UPI003AA89DE6